MIYDNIKQLKKMYGQDRVSILEKVIIVINYGLRVYCVA
jgi:hypothetical protein